MVSSSPVRRRFAAILALCSLALLLGMCVLLLLSTRRFAPYATWAFYDAQGRMPYRWIKVTALPQGLALRIDVARPGRFGGQPAAPTTLPTAFASTRPVAGRGPAVLWNNSPGEGRLFDQPTEWAWPQFRRFDAPYRDYVIRRLLLPWWLLVLLLGGAPARWTYVRLRRAHRADHGRCPACGKDLRLLDGGRCAGCGAVASEIAA